VRARFGVIEKRADPLIEFGADDVLELAGVGIGFGARDRERIGEQAFGETAAADDIAGAAFPARGERNFTFADLEQSKRGQAFD
jgi:hypothetical protein